MTGVMPTVWFVRERSRKVTRVAPFLEQDEEGLFFMKRRWTPVPGFFVERVHPEDSVDGGKPSTLSVHDLAEIADRYLWPKGVELRLSVDGGLNHQSYTHCLVVFTAFLDYGVPRLAGIS